MVSVSVAGAVDGDTTAATSPKVPIVAWCGGGAPANSNCGATAITPQTLHKQRQFTSYFGLVSVIHTRYSEKNCSPLSGGKVFTLWNGRSAWVIPA